MGRILGLAIEVVFGLCRCFPSSRCFGLLGFGRPCCLLFECHPSLLLSSLFYCARSTQSELSAPDQTLNILPSYVVDYNVTRAAVSRRSSASPILGLQDQCYVQLATPPFSWLDQKSTMKPAKHRLAVGYHITVDHHTTVEHVPAILGGGMTSRASTSEGVSSSSTSSSVMPSKSSPGSGLS